MDSNSLLLVLGGAAAVGALFYFVNRGSKPEPEQKPAAAGSNALQLQAYERLTLLVDRIAIPNLVSRTSHDGLSARDMQFVLTKTIRDEFEYNITQQIYVSADVWAAVRNLKEKNLLLINQVSAALPPDASGRDLSRALLEHLMTDKQANMPEMVSAALSFEAKKLL
jgi:hypothetical protein